MNNTAKDSDACGKTNRPGPGFLTGSGSGPCTANRSPSQDSSLRELRRWRVGFGTCRQGPKEEGAAQRGGPEAAHILQ